MKIMMTLLLVCITTAARAQNLAGTIYITPMHKGAAVMSQQLIVPSWGEGQVIGSPHAPASLLQLVKYSGSWQAGTVGGKIGPYVEYQTSTDRLATLGMFSIVKGSLLGGKLVSPTYMGLKAESGPLWFNAPHVRLIWPLQKQYGLGAGIGAAVQARSGQRTSVLVGPIFEARPRGYIAQLRLGQMVAGPLKGGSQLRFDLFRTF